MPPSSLSLRLDDDEEESRTDLHLRACSVLDISSVLTEAAGAIVDDSFTCCFKSNSPDQRKCNIYLFPLWCLGVVIRYVLLVLRVLILLFGWMIFFILFFPVRFLLKRHKMMITIIECFVASLTGWINYHGPLPSRRSDQVFVANHTSILDFIILERMTTFAVLMQEYSGWIGFLQTFILESVGCIRFNRNNNSERESVARKLQEHVQLPDNNPLLIFPEGTCISNQYTVMFKKRAFELGCAVCPIAIKYNKKFADAFWDSKKHSFAVDLFRIMTSWAVVCDVWFLEPQYIRPGETAIEFAERQRIYAESVLSVLEEN